MKTLLIVLLVVWIVSGIVVAWEYYNAPLMEWPD